MSKLKICKRRQAIVYKENEKGLHHIDSYDASYSSDLYENILQKHGYKAELLETTHAQIVDEGLQMFITTPVTLPFW